MGWRHVDAITRYTWTEVLLWTELAACTILIIALCAQADFMSVTSPTFSILVVLAMAGILGCSFLVRSLIAAVLRREQEHTVIFLHHFHMRGYLVAAAQFVLVCFVIVVSTSCPWLIAPVAGPEKYEWDSDTSPCSSADTDENCRRSTALFGPVMLCNDGGFFGYNSSTAACDAWRAEPAYSARIESCIMLSLNLVSPSSSVRYGGSTCRMRSERRSSGEGEAATKPRRNALPSAVCSVSAVPRSGR